MIGNCSTLLRSGVLGTTAKRARASESGRRIGRCWQSVPIATESGPQLMASDMRTHVPLAGRYPAAHATLITFESTVKSIPEQPILMTKLPKEVNGIV